MLRQAAAGQRISGRRPPQIARCGPVSVLTGYVSANGHKTRHQSEGIVPRGDGCLDVKEIKSSARRRRGFRIQGILDFSLIGILSKLSGILADNEIGIFAVSTFNTDYILVKDADFEKSLAVLLNAGYTVI